MKCYWCDAHPTRNIAWNITKQNKRVNLDCCDKHAEEWMGTFGGLKAIWEIQSKEILCKKSASAVAS